MLGGLSVLDSIVGTRQDLVDVFDLPVASRTRTVAQGRKLDDINDSIGEVLSGRTPARLVIEF